MLCLNTIMMRHFNGDQYERLTEAAKKMNYIKDIIKIYPDWVPNRGMGFYFQKLKMELYGTPRAYAIFEVLK